MPETAFIQVILPLRLEWEPFYAAREPLAPGDRVEVLFSGRRYVGVVSATGVTPPEGMKVLGASRSALPAISPQELRFWKVLADYYLCTVGEVYKAAYPQQRTDGEDKLLHKHERLEKRLERLRTQVEKARKDQTRQRYLTEIAHLESLLADEAPSAVPILSEIPLSPALETASERIQKAFSKGKTILLEGGGAGKESLYLSLAAQTLRQGRSVLYLVPDLSLLHPVEQAVAAVFPDLVTYHGGLPYGRKRGIAQLLRQTENALVLGTRSALLLPFRNLGLVIVDQEQDSSYKQDAPAPRYHGRESAILLAGIHGASVLLGSATPSLEALYNAQNQLFEKIVLPQDAPAGKAEVRIINTSAEQRKNGLSGSFSLKLLEELKARLDRGEKTLLICRSRLTLEESRAELEAIFPENGVETATPASFRALPPAAYSLIAVLQADGLLSREDFRSDERALQLLCQLRERCGAGGLLLIQTREAGHPVFRALRDGQDAGAFLEERRIAGFPPCTRLVDVVLKDQAGKRLNYMARLLADRLRPLGGLLLGPYEPQTPTGEPLPTRIIRLALPRDRQLKGRKGAIAATVAAFEKEQNYSGHLAIDVDPA